MEIDNFFLHLDIDEPNTKESCPTFSLTDYQAEIHENAWFLDEKLAENPFHDRRELQYHKAAYFHLLGNSQRAFEELSRLAEDGTAEQKGCHRFALADALIGQALELESLDSHLLRKLLNSHRDAVSTFGDQISHLLTSARAYARLHEDASLLRALSLLCSLCHLPGHWHLFAHISNDKRGRCLCLGSEVFAIELAEEQLSLCHGFVRRKAGNDLQEWKKRLSQRFSPEEIENARREMKHRNLPKKNDENDDLAKAAHACCSSQSPLSSQGEQSIVDCFLARHRWMLQGMEELVQLASTHSSLLAPSAYN